MGRALILLGQHLQKRVNFDTLEDAVYGIGILAGNLLSFLQRVGFDHDEAPRFVGQGSCQDNAPLGTEWFEVGQVGGAMEFSFGFHVGTIKAQDHEFHRCRRWEVASRARARIGSIEALRAGTDP